MKVTKEKYDHIYDEKHKDCNHKWEYDNDGWDVGLLENGGTYEDEQMLYTCYKCGSYRVKGTMTYFESIDEDYDDL